jgi:hypothetical protein
VVNQVTYSNPRISAQVKNWSSGVTQTDFIIFEIEINDKHGQRATRKRTGRIRRLPYAKFMRIVDGDDNKLYIVALSFDGTIAVWHESMRQQAELVYPDEFRYSELARLFVRENV